jgi:hypothetical protein
MAITNPYQPSSSASAPGNSRVRSVFLGKSGALAFFGASMAMFALSFVLAVLSVPRFVSVVGFSSASLLALFGIVLGARTLLRSNGAVGVNPLSAGAVVANILAILANLGMTAVGAFTALMSTVDFTRGRQLRRFGRVLLPKVVSSPSWATWANVGATLPSSERSLVAAQWRENGRTEHASVAAFAKLSLDLMALGAPPKLLADANRDALDEIRHTELCFGLARAIDGRDESPGPFPEARSAHALPRLRTLALAKLATDSLIDGALHEGVSARILARLGKRCEEPGIVAMLKEIAQDEGRHAAHGWDVVEWCVEEGGDAVVSALLGAIRVLPDEMRSPLPAPAADGSWERYGIHGHALEAEEYAKARAGVVRRVEKFATLRNAA